jgi:hypothetical protein
MTELSFAKSFLSTLDSRPVKLRSDYVADPQKTGLRVPVCRSRTTFIDLYHSFGRA